MFVEIRGIRHKRSICPICKQRGAYSEARHFSYPGLLYPKRVGLRTNETSCREILLGKMLVMGELFNTVNEVSVGNFPQNYRVHVVEPAGRRQARILSSAMLLSLVPQHELDFMPEYINFKYGNIRFPKQFFYLDPLLSMLTYPFMQVHTFEEHGFKMVSPAFGELDHIVTNFKDSSSRRTRLLTVEVLSNISKFFEYNYMSNFARLIIIMQQFGGLQQFHNDYMAKNEINRPSLYNEACIIHDSEWEPDKHNGAEQFVYHIISGDAYRSSLTREYISNRGQNLDLNLEKNLKVRKRES